MRNIVARYRYSATRLGLGLLIFGVTLALAANLPQVQLNSEGVAPRAIEDTTQQAVARDYAKAWQALAAAREQNRTDLLEAAFVGVAKNQAEQAVRDQQKSDIRVRYVDHGHKLQALFYSPEGSAMQLRDTANLEMQLLDGNTVVSSKQLTVNYLTVMTVAEDRWKVRVLQAVQ